MSFWNGHELNDFVFKNVKISSPQGLVALCAVSIAVAFIFEAVRTLRDWTYLEFVKKRSSHGTTAKESPITLSKVRSSSLPHENGNSTRSGSLNNTSPRNSFDIQDSSSVGSLSTATTTTTIATTAPSPPRAPVMATGTLTRKSISRPAFHIGLLHLTISSLLHVVHILLGYLLMLFVMTFNVWIFIAVIAGATLGYFLFDSVNRKIHSMNLNASDSSATTK